MQNASPSRRPVKPLRAALGCAVSFALVALLVACGSSSPGATNAGATGSPLDAAYKFSRCMREHGIKNFPDPQVTGKAVKLMFHATPGQAGAPTRQRMDAAQKACRHFMAAQRPNLSPQERAAREEQVEKFAACMRKHGVDVHASSDGGGMQVRIGGPNEQGPNPESPAFKAAQNACQGLMPMKGGPGAGRSTSSAAGKGFALGIGG